MLETATWYISLLTFFAAPTCFTCLLVMFNSTDMLLLLETTMIVCMPNSQPLFASTELLPTSSTTACQYSFCFPCLQQNFCCSCLQPTFATTVCQHSLQLSYNGLSPVFKTIVCCKCCPNLLQLRCGHVRTIVLLPMFATTVRQYCLWTQSTTTACCKRYRLTFAVHVHYD